MNRTKKNLLLVWMLLLATAGVTQTIGAALLVQKTATLQNNQTFTGINTFYWPPVLQQDPTQSMQVTTKHYVDSTTVARTYKFLGSPWITITSQSSDGSLSGTSSTVVCNAASSASGGCISHADYLNFSNKLSTTVFGTGNSWGALQTFNLGITGTGNTGTLTLGTGALNTANTWNLPQRFNGEPEYNVKNSVFGARGDWNGTSGTDDTAALTAAVAAACATGGTVHIPYGSYKISAEIPIPAGCSGTLRIKGDGAPNTNIRTGSIKGTRVVQTSTTADGFHVYPTGTGGYLTDLYFEDFTIVGSKDFTGTAGSCIHVGNGNGLTSDLIFFFKINGMNLSKCPANGLLVDGSKNATAAPFKWEANGLRATYNGNDGIFISGWVEQTLISGSWLSANTVNNLEIDNATGCSGSCGQTDAKITNTDFIPGVPSGGPVGLKLTGTNNVTLEDPYFDAGHSKMISLNGNITSFHLRGNSHFSQGASDRGAVVEAATTCSTCEFGNAGWVNAGSNPFIEWGANAVPSNIIYGRKSANAGAIPYIQLSDISFGTLTSGNSYTYKNFFAGRMILDSSTKNVDEMVSATGATDLVSQITTCMAGSGANGIRYCIIPPGVGVIATSNIARDGSNNATATVPTGHGLIVGDKIDVQMWSPLGFGCYGCAITGVTPTTVTWTSTGSTVSSTATNTGEIVKSVANASTAGWVLNKTLIDRRSWGEKRFTRDNGGTTAPWLVEIDPLTLKASETLGTAVVTSGITGYPLQVKNTVSGTGNNGLFISTTDTNGSTLILNAQVGVTPVLRVAADQRVIFGSALIAAANGQLQSTVATGTAPFTVASTTNVANLNASSLSGATFAAPGAIGGTTAAAGTFTGLTAATYSTATNCASAGGTCSAAAAGRVTIAAAATTVTVATTAVTANSEIFIQEDASLGTALSVTCNTTTGRNYTITSRTAGTSFVITSSATPSTNPACLSYRIVN
jgi:hypothetical protein